MKRHPRPKHPRRVGTATISEYLLRAPETARFLRRAAPAFLREIAKEYKRETIPVTGSLKPLEWPDVGIHAAWIGHSTVLLKVDGFTILTDPVFSTRVGLRVGPVTLGIKRLVDTAVSVEDLPEIDLILLSHAHMDHFDLPSLRRLESRETQVVTAYRTSDLLRPKRYRQVHELRWNEKVQIGGITVSAFEVQHWGARMRSDVFRGYNGYVIEAGRFHFLFGGDTAYTNSFARLRSSRAFDLAIMPIGAYDPWIRVHCNPEQAVEMANAAGAEFILPVHHQTFQLSREPRMEPIERALQAVGNAPERVCVQTIGGEFHLP